MPVRPFRIQVVRQMPSLLPEDVIVNTWHFHHDNFPPLTTVEDSANDMIDQLEEFYQGIDDTLFPSGFGAVLTAKAYDLDQPEPRVPVVTRDIAVSASLNPSMAREVAVCLSMRAELVAGTNPARRRGRVFLGPIQSGAITITNGQTVLSAGAQTQIRDAAVAAFHTGLTISDPFLSVYSPTTDAGAGVGTGDAFFQVEHIWVDNAFDTQRRRGSESTLRQAADFPGR